MLDSRQVLTKGFAIYAACVQQIVRKKLLAKMIRRLPRLNNVSLAGDALFIAHKKREDSGG